MLRGDLYSYNIIKKIGNGHSGNVYLASAKENTNRHRTPKLVAIKELILHNYIKSTKISIQNAIKINDQRKEVYCLSKLCHPNIPYFIESFEFNNMIYHSMQYITGDSLCHYVQERKFISEAEAIDITKKICNIVLYLHDNYMLHMDISPGNIIRGIDGNIYIIDFGNSMQYLPNGYAMDVKSIREGALGFTPLELIQSIKINTFNPATDIYSICATMFYMLTGCIPPTVLEILNDGFPINLLKNKSITKNTIQILNKGMQPQIFERVKDIKELLEYFEK